VIVVLTHIVSAWDGDLYLPTSKPGAEPHMLQQPIIRFFLQGRIGITIFSFVTGYACALRLIRQISDGDREGALDSIT
jgi:hypothetical protein